MHYKGQKHRKKLKMLGMEAPEKEETNTLSATSDGSL